MFQSCFVYNGKTYPSGTILKMKLQHPVLKTITNHEMVFGSISGNNVYACRKVEVKEWHYFSKENFLASIIEVTDRVHPDYIEAEKKRQLQVEKYSRMPTFREQLNIEGLGQAWIVYILVMAVAIIFYDRVMIWAFASLIFFGYRRRKLTEKGYTLWRKDAKSEDDAKKK